MENYTASLGHYLNYLNTSSQLTSANIANSNTSGYRAKEASFDAALNGGLSMEQTHHGHMQKSSSQKAYARITETNGTINEDGNNVNVTNEMIRLTKNNQMYAIAVNALNYDSGIKTAARGK
ncbi:flagellar basal body rod protein FlgB [Listeria ilorinensis]|uniref:flagellar basal body rod protein FlgB n=1 Tax=Listeria ilorinensis TaxID=2867439 RepID=UPI001EF54C2A|nr:flagellar basal body rod protein FlgB [Listeria ilorinensis]